MKSNGNCDVKGFKHTVYHTYDCVEAAHILCCTFGNTEDNRGVAFLCCKENCLCPLKVVDVELAYCVFACFCFVKHFFC